MNYFSFLFSICLLLFLQPVSAKSIFKLYNAVRKDYYKQDTSKYEVYLKEILKKEPNNAKDYQAKCSILKMLNRDDLSIVYTQKAIELYPSIYANYLLQSDNYWQVKDKKRAFEMLEQAMRIDSVSIPETYNMRGNYYVQIGEFEKAIKDYDACIRLGSNIWIKSIAREARYNKGFVYTYMGDYENAISAFKYFENDTLSYGKWSNFELAKIYFNSARIAESKTMFSDYISRYPKDSADVALCFAYLDNKESALSMLPIKGSKYKELTKAYVFSVLKEKEMALEQIEKLLECGYDRFYVLTNDIDLINIKNLPKFKELLQKYRQPE
jgi:tetratricopeptide (TPR) repeat protein